MGEGVRELSVMQNLVFEVTQLLNDLLAFGQLLGIVRLADRAVDVVNGTSLQVCDN
jgi:hypothetical protein